MTRFSVSAAYRGAMVVAAGLALTCAGRPADAQKWFPWSGFANDAQHTGNAHEASQNLVKIFWSVPADYTPTGQGVHYGSPLNTPVNLVLIPAKVGANDGFRVDARRAVDASFRWTMDTDYHAPPHGWFPTMGITLTPNNVLYMPAAGGTLLYRKTVDGATGETGRVVFYGADNYNANPSAYNNNLYVNTPLTSDKDGTIYFGYWATGDTPLHLTSGIARVTRYGVATYISATDASGDPNISKVPMNCAPALSNDGATLYVSVHFGNWSGGYLLGLDSKTLKPKYRVRLKDAKYSDNDAVLIDDSTASPTVGPDGDVYYGVLENPFPHNHDRGWMLHFDSTLAVTKIPGDFGWDNTATIIPIPNGPQAGQPYYIMTKYNNYAGIGGDGVNKIAILDPTQSMTDPSTGATVMNEVMVMPGVTPDNQGSGYPNAVREWCINTAAYDPFKRCVFANSEDGSLYRWNLNNNTLDQVMKLTPGIGEPYTPTIIGTDGLVYAINGGTLFCIGEKRGR